MNTNGKIMADREIDKNAFRLSIFLSMGKWHHFIEWLYGKRIENELNQTILYLSSYRGESVNLTINLKGILEKMQWIESFLKESKTFLAINSVNKQKSISGFNGAVFKNFTPNNIYYGIHTEFIENFQYESFEDDLQQISVEITDIILSELKEKKINTPDLIAFSIILIKVVTDCFCRKGFKDIIFKGKSSLGFEDLPTDSMYPIIMRYVEFANEVVNQLMIEPHYLKFGHALEIMLDQLRKSESKRIKETYFWILNSICVQLGIEEEVHSKIRFGFLHFLYSMKEIQA